MTSHEVAAKAQRLLEQRRVLVLDETEAVVAGDADNYTVRATPAGVVCECPARRECSHALAAQVAWAEQDTKGGS